MGEFTSESLRQRADRLDLLAHAVTEADWSEFSMRVPVEPERDADCVLSSAAIELRAYADLLERQASAVPDVAQRVSAHMAMAVEYIEKAYPEAKMLDRWPILNNLRRWSKMLATPQPPKVQP